MMIQFRDAEVFRLVTAILAQPTQEWQVRLDENQQQVEVSSPVMRELLEHYERLDAVVIPIFNERCDQWYVVGKSRHAADQTFARLSYFILPTYGVLPEQHRFSLYRRIESSDSPLIALAATRYAGYHQWLSSPHFRTQVLTGIVTAFRLDQRRPLLKPVHRKSYSELYAQFNSQLAATNWSSAENTLAEIRSLHLASAETLTFLYIQLFAMQHRWDEIWKNPNYADLANIPLPRAVRAALITAFHHTILLEPESRGEIEDALSRFRLHQARLGVLLNGRFELNDSSVIRVFGYQAVISQDQQTLADLQNSSVLDEPAIQCLHALSRLLPSIPRPQISASERLRVAMDERNYDAAMQAANELIEPQQRVGALLQLAIRHKDAQQPAYQAFLQLPKALKSQLSNDDPLISLCLNKILEDLEPKTPTIASWKAWFDALKNTTEEHLLLQSLDQLEASKDDRIWTGTALTDVAAHLNTLAYSGDGLIRRHYVKRAIQSLIDNFLNDQQFPQKSASYCELYESLYACLVLNNEVNNDNSTKLLRLADANLRQNGANLTSVRRDLKTWFENPNPSHETGMLDALDLLIEYGATQGDLISWVHHWLAKLADRPQHQRWGRANQEVWLSFAEWLMPEDGLLGLLRGSLEKEIAQEGGDPLLNLPPGFRIGIFTLRKSSAERTQTLLLKRNPDLDIRICTETDLNGPASALAKHCDIAVIVTTCISHALTYGIQPLLQNDPVYPDSQGSSSILRAIERYAKDLS